MTLTACARPETRVEFLTTKFRPDELTCSDAPRGQLPATADAETVSQRVRGIDEAGEECRQKLARARMKIEVTEEIVAEINAGKKKPR